MARNSECPSRGALERFLAGEISDRALEEVSEHLEFCSSCVDVLKELSQIRGGKSLAAALGEEVSAEKDSLPRHDLALDGVAEAKASDGDAPWRSLLSRLEAAGSTQNNKDSGTGAQVEFSKPIQIADYDVFEAIGAGGMAVVCRGRHIKLDREVAIKFLRPEHSHHAERTKRIQREMVMAGQLEHPNIVQALDAGTCEGMDYLVMEFLEGRDLSQLSRENGPLPFGLVCELARQAAMGLQRVHEAGFVHRDLKPSNLFLTDEGVVKVLDLGLARPNLTAESSELTKSQQVLGTADYMAPEQIENSRGVDIRADIFSLGATMIRLLSGKSPVIRVRHPLFGMPGSKEQDMVKLEELEIPDAVSAIVVKMTSLAPGERYSTPSEVAAALEPYCEPGDLELAVSNRLCERPSSVRRTRSRSKLQTFAWAGMLSVGALLAIGGRHLFFEDKQPTPTPSSLKEDIAPSSLFPGALVGDPLAIKGINSWSLEPRRHRGDISNLEFNSDASKLAVATAADSVVRIYGPTGSLLQVLLVDDPGVADITWSSDGEQLAVVAMGHSCYVFDVGTGQRLATIENDVQVDRIAWSPDDKMLAVSEQSGALKIWDRAAKQFTQEFPNGKTVRREVTWSHDGQSIAVCGLVGKASNWDVPNALQQKVELPIVMHARRADRSLAIGQDTITRTNSVWRVHKSSTKEILKTGLVPGGSLIPCFSADGKRFITLWTNYAILVDVETGTSRRLDFKAGVRQATISGDGRWAAISVDDLEMGSKIVLVSWDAGKVVRTIESYEKYGFIAPAWSHDGKLVAAINQDGRRVCFVNGQSLDVMGIFEPTGSPRATEAMWSPTGERKLMFGSTRGRVVGILSDVGRGALIKTDRKDLGLNAIFIAWIDSNHVVCADLKNRVVRVDMATDEQVTWLALKEEITFLERSFDRSHVAVATKSGKLYVLNAADGQVVEEASVAKLPRIEIRSLGREFDLGLQSLWNWDDGKIKSLVKSPNVNFAMPVQTLSEASDLATLASDNVIYFMDLKTGERVRTIFVASTKDWISIGPDGTHTNSPKIHEEIIVIARQGNETKWYDFEQFGTQYDLETMEQKMIFLKPPVE